MIWTALTEQHDVVWEQQAISRSSVISEQQRLLKIQAKYKETWKNVVWKQQEYFSWNMSNMSWIILHACMKIKSWDLHNYHEKYWENFQTEIIY